MEIALLKPDEEDEYERVLMSDEHTLLYASIKYRNLLRRIVGGKDFYLVAKDKGEIIGVLPTFLKYNPQYGNVINSLPFYGSNGGVICKASLSENDAKTVKRKLLQALRNLAHQEKAVISTIITSPFETHIDVYEKFTHHYRDVRIGQITILPQEKKDVDSALMATFHVKRRWHIRKAMKSKIICRHSSDIEDLRFLANVHKQNIESIGGLAKSWDFFRTIPEVFEYDKDYRVYIAELNYKPISALLVFYYNRTVEYFCPATIPEYRSLQPNSLLIFTAMKDAIMRGFKYWNWGGTWLTQKSLYDFKKRWGTHDFMYYYYVTIYDDISEIKRLGKNGILREYPYFYVLPFAQL